MYGCYKHYSPRGFGQIQNHKCSRKEVNMYASVRRYKTDPGSADELVRRVDEGFVPIVTKEPGFVAYHVLDAGDGALVSISVFEDQAGAEESDRMAADWVGENLTSLLPNAPEITAGEVRVHRVA